MLEHKSREARVSAAVARQTGSSFSLPSSQSTHCDARRWMSLACRYCSDISELPKRLKLTGAATSCFSSPVSKSDACQCQRLAQRSSAACNSELGSKRKATLHPIETGAYQRDTLTLLHGSCCPCARERTSCSAL